MPLLRTVLLQIRNRPRLAVATLAGALTFLALPGHLPRITNGLLAWDAGVGLYLVLALIMMLRSDVTRARWRASREDEGALVILALTVAAALASVAAIFVELIDVSTMPRAQETFHLALVVVTIVLSWSFIHTTFALHYAHEFYDEDADPQAPCLAFPGTDRPDYIDFLYFAFVIGTTSQTADVNISSSPMRRLALVHGVITFFFNTTLLAIAINIAAGLV